jgi:hypothetical protein
MAECDAGAGFFWGNLRNLRLAHVQNMKVSVWCESPVSMRLMRDKAKVKGVKSYALPRGTFWIPLRGELNREKTTIVTAYWAETEIREATNRFPTER